MSKYNDTSIKNLVNGINNYYLLPDIQRPFVWGDNANDFEEKVCNLFDSILRNYPIGTLLFWKVDKNRINEDGIKPLKFLDNSNKDKNEEFGELLDNKDYILVLDGQQRMTIFNLVFKGVFQDTYRNNIRKRNLYFNLYTDTSKVEDITDNLYEFKFFDENKGEYFLEDNKLWYKVKNIIHLETEDLEDKFDNLYGLFGFILNEDKKIIRKNLTKLLSSINKENISYYEIEKDKSDEEALEIFVRVNSQGMVLSYSDLLFSKITQYWKKSSNNDNYQNARDTFYYFLKGDDTLGELKGINRFGDGFNFDNDFILKTSLVLIDSEIRYKLKNFNKENIELIKENWEKITNSIRTIVKFINKIGITSSKFLRSNNSIIPLIYFIYCNNLYNKSIELNSRNYDLMKKYIFIILLNGVFGGQTDQLLSDSRKIIKNFQGDLFPLNEILKKLGEKRNIKKGEEIKDLLENIKYKTDKSKIILSLLYGNEFDKEYQEDHLFPDKKTKKFCDDNKINKSMVDNISNIQILKNENQIKNDTSFKEYREKVIKCRPNYDDLNYIPKLDDELKDYTNEYFEFFIEKRKQLIFDKIKYSLNI